MACPEYTNQFGLTQYDGQCAFFEGEADPDVCARQHTTGIGLAAEHCIHLQALQAHPMHKHSDVLHPPPPNTHT
eukprot:1145576-Pelagomonas_calceolata.AAC.6